MPPTRAGRASTGSPSSRITPPHRISPRIARLSPNRLLAKLATVYVETLRNIPLLLQLFFWYMIFLEVMPAARQALEARFATLHAGLQRGASERAAEAIGALAEGRPLPGQLAPNVEEGVS